MAKKKPTLKPVAKSTLPDFEVGSDVVIMRPHLWANCAGKVESVKAGVHIILVVRNSRREFNRGFHAEATAEELRFDL